MEALGLGGKGVWCLGLSPASFALSSCFGPRPAGFL